MANTSDLNLQAAAHSGTDAAAHAAHKIIDRVAERAAGSEEKLRESAQQAQQKLQDSWQTARAKSVDTKISVEGFVRRHPLASLAFALGVGALLVTRTKRRAQPAPANQEAAAPVH